MTAAVFVGRVALAGNSVDPSFEDRASRIAAAASSVRPHQRRVPGATFVHGDGGALLAGRNGGSVFAAAARLDNRAELADALGHPRSDAATLSDAALLLQMFERWGGAGVARCLGAFVFAHWDSAARRLTLGRDCLGRRSLFFHRSGPVVTLSDHLPALLTFPDVPRAIDDVALANLLVNNRRDARRTAYRDIARVPSRHLVVIDSDRERTAPYWTPDLDAPPPFRRDDDYVAHARELFDEAVRAATAGADEVAIALSGGLDSSAVAATVARQGRVRRIVGYTTVPSGDAEAPVGRQRYRDERGKVTALGRMYPALELNFLAAAEAHPFDVEPARYFAQAQLPRRSGLNLGLVGTLTDALAQHPLALFGSLGNLGLSWSGRFALLARLRAGEIAGFARDLPRVLRRDPRGARDVLLSDVVAPAMPASLRRVARRLRGRRADGEAPDGVLNPEFIATHDLPRLWDMQQFGPGFRIDGWNPKRYRAWAMFDRAGVDRDNTGWAMRSHGVEVRDPFADRRLLEFALAVPEPLYRRDGIPRSFARAVFADRLPPEILHETRRGAGNLDWFGKAGRQRPLWAAEIERLEASATARRLLDLPRLKRLVADWPRHTGPNPRALHERDLLDRAMHVGGFIRWVEGGNA